ncbi:hypothetical protein PSTT_05413 [Puccinia striiformis]|uniref:Uncharacterized protein n=1 Tax=Puccinia striiformis TaxID=27350 RepID=A0A2S4VP05_9BASI|nr:hypothetical protein PSTT_05413 [Puccinia striiformis]
MYKTPFTINGQMSSAEINNVRDEVRSLSSSIEIAVESLFEFYDFNSMEDQMIQFVRGLMQGLTGHFDEAIILLGFYLVPTAPRLDPTSSENFFKDLFLATRQQFRVAMSHTIELDTPSQKTFELTVHDPKLYPPVKLINSRKPPCILSAVQLITP